VKPGLIFVSGSAALLACGGSGDRACVVGADCASGVCIADGTCAVTATGGPEGPGTGTLPDGATVDGATRTDGGAGGDATPGDDANAPGCAPNHDGTITRDEVPLGPGLHAKYRVAQNAGVDTAGTAQSGGSRVWDLTGDLPGDHALLVETAPVAGQWFAGDYAAATYTARLSDSADLLGVFETTSAAILLRGEVSPAAGATATKLVNSAGVGTLQFPMTMGSSWQSNVNVTGTAQGIPVAYTEAYTSTVDAHGVTKTPFGAFDVLRVKTVLTRTVGVVATTIRTFSYVAECAGPVATIVSQTNEANAEFTTAAEVQRLAP
jgi:hypothetical protein